MGFQKCQPTEAGHEYLPSASTSPLKNMDASSPAQKAHAHEIHEKADSISSTCELPWPVREDMKKRLATKPVWGRTSPVCSVELSVTRNIDMAVELTEVEKLAHGRIQFALPVRKP
jgi:hypothetical protein